MNTIRKSLYFPVLVLSVVAVCSEVSADATLPDGEALYREKACVICHGEAGKNTTAPMYPKLAGQSKEYLIAQTKDIQTAKRTNGFTKLMMPFMGITDEEIQAIAEYLSRQ